MQVPSGVGQLFPKIFRELSSLLETFIITGNKLLGLPKGLSPKRPEQFAPTGLNYLNVEILHFWGSLLKISANHIS